ncbi:MAG: hypothetical protein KF724_09045 [Phycisphaeraceae bacterium]|nr:hypothetical protein [Phycisphaeraceae bacterium]
MSLKPAFVLTAALATASSASATILYSTGFESPPFTVGSSVNGIDGWLNGSGGGVSQSVSTAQAASGSNSLLFDNSSLFSFYSVRHNLGGWNGQDILKVSTKLYVDGSTQANRLYGLYLTNVAAGTLGSTTLGLSIGGDGIVRAGKNWAATYENPGIIGTAGAGTFTDRWLTIEFLMNATTGNADVTISGFSDASSINSSFSGVSIPLNLNLGSDYFDTTNRAGKGYFDDLSIEYIPTPGAIALLSMGALAGLRRRRD